VRCLKHLVCVFAPAVRFWFHRIMIRSDGNHLFYQLPRCDNDICAGIRMLNPILSLPTRPNRLGRAANPSPAGALTPHRGIKPCRTFNTRLRNPVGAIHTKVFVFSRHVKVSIFLPLHHSRGSQLQLLGSPARFPS
jgi:hypothetical protein